MVALMLMAGGTAMAGSLPQDTPVQYPGLELDSASVQALELDDSAVSEDAPRVQLDPGGDGAVRPGEKPQTNSFTIRTVSDITFASPFAPAEVNATNPEGSTVITQYTLQISLAELECQIGRTGHTPEQMAELQAQDGYDPEISYVTLAETKGIRPGSMVQTMVLGALPDGSTLPAGDYQADMVVASYDVQTNRRSMVGGLVKVKFHILTDQMSLIFDESGLGELHAFNPSAADQEVVYGIQISQQAIVDGCGNPHRTQDQLAAQQANPDFDPAYEFITILESEAVAPGSSLEGTAQLLPLPDGQMLPKGEYTAWLVRFTRDQQTGLWKMLDARTQLALSVGRKAGDAGD